MPRTNEQQSLESSVKMLAQGTAMAKNLTEAGQAFLAALADVYRGVGPDAKKLHGQPLTALYCGSTEEKKELTSKMGEKGVPYLIAKAKDGRSVIVIREKDKAKLNAMHRDFCQKEKAGFISKQALWDRAGGEVKKYSGLTPIQAHTIAKKAEEAGVGISLQNPKQGRYEILFSAKDGFAMAKAATSAAYDLAGESGETYAKQAAYEEENRVRIAGNAVSRFQPDFYIVDAGRNIFCVSEHRVECEVSGERSVILKNGHEKEINTLIMNLKRPVDLTPAQFKEYALLPDKEQEKFLEEADRAHGRPDITQRERELSEIKEKSRGAMEAKLLKENPAQDYIIDPENGTDGMTLLERARSGGTEGYGDMAITRADPGILKEAMKIQRSFVMADEARSPEMEEREKELFASHDRAYATEVAAALAEQEAEKGQETSGGTESGLPGNGGEGGLGGLAEDAPEELEI